MKKSYLPEIPVFDESLTIDDNDGKYFKLSIYLINQIINKMI